MNIQDIDRQYIAATYNRFPVSFLSGKGSLLTDDEGKQYIDLGAGIAVNTLGLCDDEWVQAVTYQLQTLQHVSNIYTTQPGALLARELCSRTGMKKVFLSNSGAEANECMIKAARKYARDRYGEQRQRIITLENSFHGRTITTLSATGQPEFHKHFGPFTGGFAYTPANDTGALISLIEQETPAAVMIEIIQGEGGVKVLSSQFLQAISEICREQDILLLIDEIQTGNGRTGTLYAYMQYELSPDIVSTAKGLAGGLPLGATMFGEKTADTLIAGTHGSTFGGNPVCCAGALNILSRLTGELLTGVMDKGNRIRRVLGGCKGVKEVTGLGLMIGIDTVRPAAEIVSGALANGVACLLAHDRVRLLPALNIPDELLNKALDVLRKEMGK